MQDDSNYQALAQILRQRRTTKAMADAPWPPSDPAPAAIEKILAAATEAPFHKPAARENRSGALAGIQPWRGYVLDSENCRKLRQLLIEQGDNTKIPQMLAVADYLIQVTWLPNPAAEPSDALFEPSIQNMEHIAAASAAIQNMLLAATTLDFPNYWSSGGALRSAETFSLLGIPPTEILLGSLFLFPQDLADAATKAGGLRHSRSPHQDWARYVTL